MNKYLKLTALCSAMLLVTACGNEKSSTGTDSSTQYEPYINASLAQKTKVDFTLQGANASVPLPTFILMNQKDGTLEIPTGGDDSLSNPKAALSQMDGWSTTEPMTIPFKGAGFTTGVQTSGVYIIKLSESLTGSPTPTGILKQNTDFTVVAQGNNLNIIFSKPLEEKTNYVVAITDDIKDKNGDSVGMSSSYATLITKTKTFTSGSLAQLQKVLSGIGSIVEGTKVADLKKVVYSTWFTTQSVGDTLYATKAAVATGLASKLAGGNGLGDIWKGSANPNNVDLSAAYTLSITSSGDYDDVLNDDENFSTYIDPTGATQTALNSQAAAAAVTVSKGIVNLPYFLEKGATWNSQPFQSAMPSLAIIKNALEGDDRSTVIQQLVENGIDPAKLFTDATEQLKLIGVDLKDDSGQPLDPERIITQYSPVPKIKSLEEVPFLLFTPKGAAVGSTPIVIYQHGITSVKETAYAFAANMVASGISVIAIDHPLHGQRSLDAKRSANVDPTAYINLAYLPVARDNVRESILDIIGLRAALSVTAKTLQAKPSLGATINFAELTKVNFGELPRFMGHSLGGIVGVSAVAAANETLGNADADQLFSFSSGAFANAGGQIAPLLINSDTFGPAIKKQIGDAATIAAFSYAAQTVLDTVDPINTASYIDPALPVYLSEVDGDKVVPNKVANTFAGTEPLALTLGLTATNASNTAVDGTRNWVQFNNGASHSTVIAPTSDFSDLSQHTEMQTELIDFLLDNQLTGVSDTTTLK
ncbi:lipase [Vibrio sp. S17_S38]|uniref:VolA/Pla-1 family phospholipase n=1 Tax=Vibrio sp. S17_S38 TaxID=2720229 RepID=UPI0016804BB9|nr:VolA/Pla-1 family phospholipase [Vibrio sp. S17_S38]MBD1573857.1 lipase [Vibrio sp. S17_S38]